MAVSLPQERHAAGSRLGGLAGETPDIVLENEARRLPAGAPSPLPKTLDELAKYHTVILGDVSPQLIGPQFVEMLAEAVRERGRGIDRRRRGR